MMSKKGLITVSVPVLGALLISYQAGLYVQKNKQAHEIGDTNVKLLPLLTKPSDFNSKNISWEKAVYQFDVLTRDRLQVGKAVSMMPGEIDGNNAGFVLIHEIIVYPKGNVPSSNPSEYYSPSPLNNPFPNAESSNESYCWSSEVNYLSECSITIKNEEIISTFTIRIFEPNDQIASEILPLAVEKFNSRLNDSDYGN